MPIPTGDFIDRARAAIRGHESDRKSRGWGDEGPRGGPSGLTIKVIGARVAVTTTTSTTGTGTTGTTTTTSTTTTCPPPPTTLRRTTTTPPPAKSLYPAQFVYRNFDALSNQEFFFAGELCWACEVNDGPLGQGCRYPGQLGGEYMGLAVINVHGTGDSVPCTGADTTVTPAPCSGVCDWALDIPSGKWVLSESSCCPAESCDCPQPDFCPPNPGDCGNTETFCTKGDDHTIPIVNCPSTTPGSTTTGTTGTTATTTSVTPDPLACGTGCVWKHVAGIGWINTFYDCNEGLGIANGCFCMACGVSLPLLPADCTEYHFLCGTFCPPPPPPPYCNGDCLWVSDGDGWHALSIGCVSSGIGCGCEPPSVPGFCGLKIRTSCRPPKDGGGGGGTTLGGGTTTAGGGTTTLRGSTTTLGGCQDSCILVWVTDHWEISSDCGPSCACETPLFDGEDNCSIAKVVCKTTTTSFTSTTTVTSTTTACGTSNCSFFCDGSSWSLVANCTPPCGCPGPDSLGTCDGGSAGTTSTVACTFGTGTSTTTRTTSTTAPPPCCGSTAPCVFQCAFVGLDTDPDTGDPVSVYEWAICRSQCCLDNPTCCHCTLPLGPGGCMANQAGECVTGLCNPIPGCTQCPPGQCNDSEICVECSESGVAADGTEVRRCSDCVEITVVDTAIYGATGRL